MTVTVPPTPTDTTVSSSMLSNIVHSTVYLVEGSMLTNLAGRAFYGPQQVFTEKGLSKYFGNEYIL